MRIICKPIARRVRNSDYKIVEKIEFSELYVRCRNTRSHPILKSVFQSNNCDLSTPPLIQMESHIKKFFNALSIFETLLPRNMYVHHVQVFLFITSKHSVTYREIEKKFQVTNASASRTVHTLAENPPRHRKNCLKLVEIYIHPEEGR